MELRNKRILITAGPTWVAIDNVRVISNIATGSTGILLADKLQNLGAKVTLLLGAVESCCLNGKIRIIHFKFFEDLRNRLREELSSKKYDYVIHSAAVSDFAPRSKFKGKLDSGKSISLSLKLLPKIYKDIRRISSRAKLVLFKLENRVSDDYLIQAAKLTRSAADAEFIVANRLNPYRAFIIDREGNTLFKIKSKSELVNKLLKVIK